MRPEEYFGGDLLTSPTGDIQLLPTSQRFVAVNPLSNRVRVFLPSALGLSLGPRRHLFLNLSTDRFFAVHRGDGTLIGLIPPQWSVWVHLSNNTTAGGVWGIGPFRLAFALSQPLADTREYFSLTYAQGSVSFNVNVRDEVDKQGYTGANVARVHVNLEGGALIGSQLNLLTSFATGTFPAGSVIAMSINPGAALIGRGGAGGSGNIVVLPDVPGRPGLAGGTALRIDTNMVMINAGAIVGGGGGGGGGGGHFPTMSNGGGGGGGAGGLGGSRGGPFDPSFSDASQDGTLVAPGFGAKTQETPFHNGGKGGLHGKPGTSGSIGIAGDPPGAGGGAGISISRAPGKTIQFQTVGAIIGPQVVA